MSHRNWSLRLFRLDWTIATRWERRCITALLRCWQRCHITTDLQVCSVSTGLLQLTVGRPTTHLRRTISASTERSCSSGAEFWSLWSRDTSTEAATLVTCRTQNQLQAVYIDVSNSHWACTTVLGSLCAVNCWIQSSTRSEVHQHRWLSNVALELNLVNDARLRWFTCLELLTWQH